MWRKLQRAIKRVGELSTPHVDESGHTCERWGYCVTILLLAFLSVLGFIVSYRLITGE